MDVGCLVPLDLLEACTDPRQVAGGGKGLLVELVEAFGVEGVLEMLEGEGVLQDFRVWGITVSTPCVDAAENTNKTLTSDLRIALEELRSCERRDGGGDEKDEGACAEHVGYGLAAAEESD